MVYIAVIRHRRCRYNNLNRSDNNRLFYDIINIIHVNYNIIIVIWYLKSNSLIMLCQEGNLEATNLDTLEKRSDHKITVSGKQKTINSTKQDRYTLYNEGEENKVGTPPSQQLQIITNEFLTPDRLVIPFNQTPDKQENDLSLEMNVWTSHEAPLPVFMWKIKKPHIMTIYSPTQCK